MSAPGYKGRLLKIYGINMWNTFHMDRAIQFVGSCNLMGIIFHCDGLIDKAMFPDKCFDKGELLGFNPIRNSVTKSYRYYLRLVLDKRRGNGLRFYGEVKEIYFYNGLVTKHPQLRRENGALCATNPFWWEFLEKEYWEFSAMFPDVVGIIVSPGTGRSMVSFTVNHCICQHHRDYDVDERHRNLLTTTRRAINRAGKKLIIKGFPYTKAHRYTTVDAIGNVSDSITMSIKKVPYDYYLVFPDDLVIGNCEKLNQWVEFDTQRQFFGLKVFPCSVSKDTKGRMRQYLGKGAIGTVLRIDQEDMIRSSMSCGSGILNLITGVMISFGVNTGVDTVYDAWSDHGLASPLVPDDCSQISCRITEGKDRELFREMIRLCREVLEKGIHVRDHMLDRSCQIFDRYDPIYSIMTVSHSRDQRRPNTPKRVEPTEEGTPVMIAEKDEALATAQKLRDMVAAANPGVNHSVRTYLEFVVEGFSTYIEGFCLELVFMIYTKKAEISQDPGDVQKAGETLTGYEGLTSRYGNLVKDKGYSHVVEYVLGGDRLTCFKADIGRVLNVI